MSHIRKDHPNFKEELHKNFAFGTPGVTKKVLYYSRWFEWTIMEKREFGFCENFQLQNIRTCQYRKTEPISKNALQKYITLIAREVESEMEMLPEKLGIIFDGWSPWHILRWWFWFIRVHR